MAATAFGTLLTSEEFWALAELAETAFKAKNPNQMAEAVIPIMSDLFKTAATFLYYADPRLSHPLFFQRGLLDQDVPSVISWCVKRIQVASHELSIQQPTRRFELFLLTAQGRHLGVLGLEEPPNHRPTGLFLERALSLLSLAFVNLLDRAALEKQLHRLNTYMNVSSLMTQAADLGEVLEAVLSFSMEALSAQAASVLLLDHEKKNFRFYSIEGPAKPVLLSATFPADQGLAGSVLWSGRSEVVNDVHSDPRFYDKIDTQSGFVTHNMVVIPLTAGEEKIGVLEVLNKADGTVFTEEDRLLLEPIAEQIAFAIRNAKIFEVVVKSYCKQRQGLNTCIGCNRPLGSWTPCVKYRKESGLLA